MKEPQAEIEGVTFLDRRADSSGTYVTNGPNNAKDTDASNSMSEIVNVNSSYSSSDRQRRQADAQQFRRQEHNGPGKSHPQTR